MAILGAVVVSVLICFTSASPTRQVRDSESTQQQILPKDSTQDLRKLSDQTKQFLPQPVETGTSKDTKSVENLKEDLATDLNKPPAGDNNLDSNVLNADRSLTNEFVKKVLREFFDELKKRPDLVEQILKHETIKELMRPRQDVMFLPNDLMAGNLPEIKSQPAIETNPQVPILSQTETQSQNQVHIESQTPSQALNQEGVEKEVNIKRDNQIINSTNSGSEDQIADSKSQAVESGSKTDTDMLTSPLQDSFYYYLYYPDEDTAGVGDMFPDSPSFVNYNNDNNQLSEDSVINSLAKSVMAVIQDGLVTNTDSSSSNNNKNGVDKKKEKGDSSSVEKGGNGLTNKSTNNISGTNTQTRDVTENNKEENDLSRLART